MKKDIESILEEISKNKFLSRTTEKLSDEEKKKVDSIVRNFVENFVLSTQELIEKAEDPNVKSQIRKILEDNVSASTSITSEIDLSKNND